MCGSSGCCSQVPSNCPAWCWESVWCQTPEVSWTRKTLTHLIFGLSQGLWQRGCMAAFRSAQLRFSSLLCSVTLISLSAIHSILFQTYFLYQVIKISSNSHKHKDMRSNTPCTSSACPWLKWQFQWNHQTKAIWTTSLLFPASWRVKWPRMAYLTSLWPRKVLQIQCKALEMTPVLNLLS